MNLNSILAGAAAILAAALALGVALRSRRSLARRCFSIGMLLFSIESALACVSFAAASIEQVAAWQKYALLVKSFIPGVWLCFSLTYSRANYRDFLVRSRLLLIATFLIPLCWLPALRDHLFNIAVFSAPQEGWAVLFQPAAKLLNAAVLIGTVLILTNLERTFRSAVGTMRWRIKFLIIGLAVIFGARIYTATESLLFSGDGLAELNIRSASLLIGCALIAVGYFRSGFAEIDLYPSRAVLHTSVTVLLTGIYLLVVGVLAQIVVYIGGATGFPVATFLVLLGLAGLAVLLLSERFRHGLQLFVSRHFKRPQHDFRQIWARFTKALSTILEEAPLTATASRLVSETFQALSVSIWLFDEDREHLSRLASTAQATPEPGADARDSIIAAPLASVELGKLSHPFNPKKMKEPWAKCLGEIGGGRFRTGGDPLVVPLIAGERWLGLIVLADRVGGLRYTAEEMDLLKCIGDQIAANLLNLRLTKELMERKEMEAFQAIAAFFVHDLKNAASTLGLMLQNLPVHFDDPDFRQDALRGIESAAGRINELVARMNAFRHGVGLDRAEIDINSVVEDALAGLDGTSGAELVTALEPVPPIVGDRSQLQSLFTNLVLNATEAIEPGQNGRIAVATGQHDNWVSVSISDNGCGMSDEFVKNSLFRPFHTTKKKGIGIGMFQAKMIVEAHQGVIQVKSAPGEGTTFRVLLPAQKRHEFH